MDENNTILNDINTFPNNALYDKYSTNPNDLSPEQLDDEDEDFDEFDIASSDEYIVRHNGHQKGSPTIKRHQYLSRPLDSYQEEDLERIREQWQRALLNRHNYLETQIKEVS